MSNVVVVGGGVAGLAAARVLIQRGLGVTLLEQAQRPGGVIRSSSREGFLREHAANGFLGSDEGGAVALARELGVEMCAAAPAAKRRWIYVGGQLCAAPTNPIEAVRTPLLSLRGKLKFLGEPLRPAGDGQRDETIGDFARRRFGDEVARNIIGPVVTGIFAGDADELSLRAAFPVLAELDTEGGMIRGMIKRQIAARREGKSGSQAKKTKKGGRGLHAPLGGAEMLVRALADQLSSNLRTGVSVTSLKLPREPSDTGLCVHTNSADSTEDTSRYHGYHGYHGYHADAVVLATPADVSARIVADEVPELALALEEIPYAPVAVVHLGFDRADVPHALDGFGFLVAKGENLRILGCVFESIIYPNRAPDGAVLLRCMFGGGRDPAAAALSDEDLVSIARRDLDRTLGIEHKPVHVHIARYERAIAQYTVGHLDRVARAESLAEPKGIVLAGSAYHGVAVNKCVSDAHRVADVVESLLRRTQGVARSGATAMWLGLLGLAALTIAACGSTGAGQNDRTVAPGDGGDSRAVAAVPPGPTPSTHDAGSATGKAAAGTLQVSVTWADPPAELLRSPGLNKCGATIAPPVSVHTLNGLRNAIVSLEGVARAGDASAESAQLIVRDCSVEPRVQVVHLASGTAAKLEVENADESRHVVRILRDGAAPLAEIPLPLLGQRYRLTLSRPGLLVANLVGARGEAYVWVTSSAFVATTDDTGAAQFSDVPPGSYHVQAWHPPVQRGGAALVARAAVTVESGKTSNIELKPRP